MLEIGFLNAIVRSAYMPPYDPFFAGTFINYYYYGLYLVNVMVKLTGIEPVVAFNLAVPMLAALTAVNVFSLAGNLAQYDNRNNRFLLSKGIISGLLAVLFVVFFSNLDGMGQFLRNLAEISDSQFSSAIPGLETLVKAGSGLANAWEGAPVREYDFWGPSRVIPTTINEFPYWSFLFADLHPHMIGIPFTALFLGLAYAWLKSDPEVEPLTGIVTKRADVAEVVATPKTETARETETEVVPKTEIAEAVIVPPELSSSDDPAGSEAIAFDILEPATNPSKDLSPAGPATFWGGFKTDSRAGMDYD